MEEKVVVTIEIPRSIHADMLETIASLCPEEQCSIEEYLAEAALLHHEDFKEHLERARLRKEEENLDKENGLRYTSH